MCDVWSVKHHATSCVFSCRWTCISKCTWPQQHVTKMPMTSLPVPCFVWNELYLRRYIWQQLHTFSEKKNPNLQCAEQSGICSISDGSAVNHQSCHKDLESPFFTGSLPTYTVPWECSPPLHGNLKDDEFQWAYIKKTSGISLLRLTAYSEGLIHGSHLHSTSLHFNSQRNPSGRCQHSHAWKSPHSRSPTHCQWRMPEGVQLAGISLLIFSKTDCGSFVRDEMWIFFNSVVLQANVWICWSALSRGRQERR